MIPTLFVLAGMTAAQPDPAAPGVVRLGPVAEAPAAEGVARVQAPPEPAQKPPGGPDPGNVTGEPLNLTVTAPKPQLAAAAPAAAAAAVADRWAFMRAVQGTWMGVLLDDNRMSVSGWTEMAYTASTAKVSNLPVTWNDRANEFLLHQNVLRVERATVPSAAGPTWGFRVDTLFGSDYRYTMARGLFESQLQNSQGSQNLYGFDPVDFYLNVYFPNLFRGTEVAVGRFLTPVSSESELTILTPLLTRSMSFNWGGPFTHTGLSVTSKLSDRFTARAILALGNEAFIDPVDELRVVGSLVWTGPGARDIVTFNTTLGRGKFNAGEPFAPPTFAGIQEPAGRNNINVFDLIWTHQLSTRLTSQTELEFGYQYGVPTTAAIGNVAGALISDDRTVGTAQWGSVIQYFFYKWSPKFTTITRLEAFDDFDGQRTGFKGLYSEVTTGFQYSFTKAVTFRPELRYDYNGYSTPFEGKHGIFTAAFDVIVRW